jgi:hypothetical protein
LREAFENVESYLKNVWIDLHRTRWQQIVNKVDFSLKKPGNPSKYFSMLSVNETTQSL